MDKIIKILKDLGYKEIDGNKYQYQNNLSVVYIYPYKYAVIRYWEDIRANSNYQELSIFATKDEIIKMLKNE